MLLTRALLVHGALLEGLELELQVDVHSIDVEVELATALQGPCNLKAAPATLIKQGLEGVHVMQLSLTSLVQHPAEEDQQGLHGASACRQGPQEVLVDGDPGFIVATDSCPLPQG